MRLLRLLRKTSGGYHGWYETDKGFNVRKPLGMVYNEEVETKTYEGPLEASYPVATIVTLAKTSWWRRLLNWLWK